jgi:nitroreductase/ferredoxin
MPIPTSRTNEAGSIHIDKELCTGCGLCVSICGDHSLKLENNKATVNYDTVFGCFACGQCMAVCPKGAITVSGRTLSETDVFDLAPVKESADYSSLLKLLQRRRSIRDFTDEPVSVEMIEQILVAARTSPMGIPPSDVNVLVIEGKENNHTFAKEFCEHIKGMTWIASNLFLTLMRPFWGKEMTSLFKSFIKPLMDQYIGSMENGENLVTYDAPLSMYFYGGPYSDPADTYIAATVAMYAGESLGLGTCMIGGIHPMIQNGPKSKQFREAHNIKNKSKSGIVVIFGHPKLKFRRGIRRTFASEESWKPSN